MAKNVLKQVDMIALADAIREVCHKSPEGFAIYDEGWSDQRIVDESKGRLTIYNVRLLRQNLVGEIPRNLTAPSGTAELMVRLAKLEA